MSYKPFCSSHCLKSPHSGFDRAQRRRPQACAHDHSIRSVTDASLTCLHILFERNLEQRHQAKLSEPVEDQTNCSNLGEMDHLQQPILPKDFTGLRTAHQFAIRSIRMLASTVDYRLRNSSLRFADHQLKKFALTKSGILRAHSVIVPNYSL
ncbi:hypothetical protein TNCV_4782681 [Trichonephila clavipes]|nr:hypothetical protein TNCV_4782681 [Trichonephila clavipes]